MAQVLKIGVVIPFGVGVEETNNVSSSSPTSWSVKEIVSSCVTGGEDRQQGLGVVLHNKD